jgi:hypothetical protein
LSRTLRRAVALALAAVTLAGCTKTVEVPRDQFQAAAATDVNHRIDLTDGTYYIVGQFSVTDSALVIEKLNGGDLRYGETKLPITLSFGEIESISRLEAKKGPLIAILVTGAVVIGFMTWVSNWDLPAD